MARTPKKTEAVRRKKIKVNLAILPRAIMEGRLVAKIKAPVLFERVREGKTEIHAGKVMSYDAEKGHVSVYDETVEQWFLFDTANPPDIRVETEADLVEGTLQLEERNDEIDLIREHIELTKFHLAVLEKKLGKFYIPVLMKGKKEGDQK